MTLLQEAQEPMAEEVAAGGQQAQRSVLTRIATVIDAFKDGRPLSLDDLTMRTGLPRSTVYRLAEQLRAVGWIERVSSGYRIGLRLFEVGGLAGDVSRLRAQACTWLYQAQQQSAQTVHLGILDGDEVVYVDKVGPVRGDVPTRIGGRFPAHRTALGRALLAARAGAEFEALLDAADDRPEAPGLPGLRTALETARRTDIATECGTGVRGLACVATPIRAAGGVVAAISITGPVTTYRATLQRNVQILRAAAEGIASRATPTATPTRRDLFTDLNVSAGAGVHRAQMASGM